MAAQMIVRVPMRWRQFHPPIVAFHLLRFDRKFNSPLRGFNRRVGYRRPMPWTRPDLRLPSKPTPLWTMRRLGRRVIMVYCGDDRCHHQAELNADCWADDVAFGDLQSRMLCSACGHKGADVRPDWATWAVGCC
jgi:hypothetical protein